MISNFEFLKIDYDTAELFQTANTAEENYTHKDYEGTLIKVRKIAENTARLIADREYVELPKRSTFNDVLRVIKKKIINQTIVDNFYNIKGKGNNSAHVLNPEDATQENALKALEQVFYILVWFMIEYVDDNVTKSLYDEFLEPRAQELYDTAVRKFIYIQTVDNKNGLYQAYEGTQKIGEGTVSSDDIEADWTPNSEFLRKVAPKRINQYMKTAGLPYTLGWVELAYKKSSKSWFHDYDVHNVLKRSGIKHVLEGKEWFQTDLETAKSAITAVKEGRDYLNHLVAETAVEFPKITLRPEQNAAVQQTQTVFKKKNKMLWNAKMRFGKTLTSLELIKKERFEKVLIMTHRPVVSDSWFEDFKKMCMADKGYEYGSANKGAAIQTLKQGENPFIYFASIQLLRYNNAQTNLKDYSDIDWDLIIIDEAHEGTQTELSDVVLGELVKEHTKVLELSGTPFNLLDQFDEEQVYTWDYTMEQTAKLKWDLENPSKPNPYETLPKVSMYTFEMKDTVKFADESKSFNFREFFKVNDEEQLVYKREVRAFLDNITNLDSKTHYPFSTKEYRDKLRHTLWLMPGVKEANAFEELLKEHPIFGKEYQIVNVVRGNQQDDGIANDADIEKVRSAITDDPSQTKTITLTVRRLTTGVNIPEWTAVIFLSNTNSAMNYLQAAFRAQTPFSHPSLGMKKNCYVFDFAPDRALTVMAESAQINSGVGKKNTEKQKQAMTTLLNFMPILGSSGHGMKNYDVDKMLTQLKKVYAEKAVRSGFEDDSLYNDNLLTLTADDADMFTKLNGIVGKTTKQKRATQVVVNDNGLTNEEYDQSERAKKKPARQRTEEEKELLEKVKEAKKQRKNMISILRGVSIRIPMMIYGMKVDLAKDITIKDFINEVDDESWKEFMPKGFTKGMFKEITKYYDAEVFIEAGRIIRQRAKSFDSLDFIERAEKIAELFGSFKNPDKETVLTPWRVVNMQTTKSVGGLNFYDDAYQATTDGGSSNLHWVEKEMTDSIYYPETKILDINSKTGLYPLHAAISLYYKKVMANEDNHFEADQVYQDILKNNIYAIAKTPMAKTITERTLTGYRNYQTNIIYIENLTDTLKKDITKAKETVEEALRKVKFDVVIGNPPYQESDNNGKSGSARPMYDKFIELSILLKPNYITLITPSVWFLGGKGLDDFRRRMLDDIRFKTFNNFVTPNDIFNNVNLRGGVNYFLWDENYNNKKMGVHSNTYENKELTESGVRPYKIDGVDIFISGSKSFKLLTKLIKSHWIDVNFEDSKNMLYQHISERNPFGISTTAKLNSHSSTDNSVKIFASKGKVGWISEDKIGKNSEYINVYKVLTAFANNIGTDLSDDNLNTIISEPHSVCTETYLVVGAKLGLNRESAINLSNYLQTKFVRYLISLAKANQNGTRRTYRFVPLQDFTVSSDIDWSQSVADIDRQLYQKYGLTEDEITFIETKVKEMS